MSEPLLDPAARWPFPEPVETRAYIPWLDNPAMPQWEREARTGGRDPSAERGP